MPQPNLLALRGDLLDFTAKPEWGAVQSPAVRFRPDHWLLIEKGRIVRAQPGDQVPDGDWELHDHRGHLILPGFIETHVHSPQLDVVASYGTELLDWLDTYTFPAELRQADAFESEPTAARFLDALLSHGTTSAAVFPTVHKGSVDALFGAARTRGMRIIAGKVLMDRHAPDGLRDLDLAQTERDSIALIERWHDTGRLSYAVTVRFAPTSTPEQLAMAGRLCAAYPGVYMQTHVAENRHEVRWVAELFPEARSYLDVYAQAGLLGPRSVLAHGIWLDDADRSTLQQAGAHIAHCPSSNLFLGSGLFNWQQAERAGVAVSVASDVGGGTSLCLLRAMADAYRVQALQGERLTAWKALHASTRGAASALDLTHEIGSLDAGLSADLCVWDWASGPVAHRRMAMVKSLHEKVFAWMNLADERNLAETWVAGECRYRRDPA
jgi:guanine deaminase